MTFTGKEKEFFEEHGYYVARGVFSPAEVAEIREHFMAMRREGPKPGDMGGDPRKATDPLNQFPRMINMHRWDPKTEGWQKDPRLTKLAGHLVGDDVVLRQTMLYFKPPGARGQALHQDNQYIRVFPIIAAWLALDDCDDANGQMTMIPGSNKEGILPVQPANREESFTNGQSFIPDGSKELGIGMKAGDVLFFGGFTIHGSYPNKTTDRFRRCFIVHYQAAHTEELPADASTNMTSVA
jgi:ectoine hydroxylase-related dioxygenase (phytanoyl-CoA dioxygenase family)